ncbi:type II and III secretion system protein family protein [Blastopirellula marina]|uniref:Secretion system protein n=1 Tax=Blastopirellula marina TaxID=124 RepID=A0A2S8GHD0_9BACT|nr:pilus assembly protein N-terminal domain-containing protein [Blastopirellula marina]PQO43858.1 secretion system protein [Blastopirellula marina]
MLLAAAVVAVLTASPLVAQQPMQAARHQGKLYEFAPPAEQGVRLAQANGPQQIVPISPLPAPAINQPPLARLDQLEELPPGLRAPMPDAATQNLYGNFIRETIDPQNVLDLVLGRPRILVFNETPIRIYLPDERVATYQVISDREISIVGNAVGTTVLNIWVPDADAPDKQRVLSYFLRVAPDVESAESMVQRYKRLEQEINQGFPESYVQLSFIGNRLIVRGEAKDAVEATQILEVLAVNSPTSQAAYEEANPLEIREQYIRNATDQLIQDEIQNLGQRLRRANVVNLLRIPGEQQVMLRVTVAEVNRNALRQIGADMQIGSSGDVSFLSLLLPETLGTFTGGNLAVDSTDFKLALNALRDMGYARTLAEPNLTTLNGKPAMFRAGDTFPVPLAESSFGGTAQGVQQEFVGVDVNFVPYITDRDRVRLIIRGSVSARDDQQSANVGGTDVPGTNTRDFSTTVELRDGQTLAIGGLMQTTLQTNDQRVPFLGDIPVVGTLFSNKSTSAQEQELVIIVTPQLVHPLEQCMTPPLPGADVFEPTDIEFFLGNRLESNRARDFRSSVRTDFGKQLAGERCHEAQFLIGPTGQSFNCCNQPMLFK